MTRNPAHLFHQGQGWRSSERERDMLEPWSRRAEEGRKCRRRCCQCQRDALPGGGEHVLVRLLSPCVRMHKLTFLLYVGLESETEVLLPVVYPLARSRSPRKSGRLTFVNECPRLLMKLHTLRTQTLRAGAGWRWQYQASCMGSRSRIGPGAHRTGEARHVGSRACGGLDGAERA